MHTKMAYRGSGSTAPLIPSLSNEYMRVVRLMPQPLYPWQKSTWYPLKWRLGGTRTSLDILKKKVSCPHWD